MSHYRVSQRAGMALVLLAAGCAPRSIPTPPWRDSFPLALEAALESGKPTLVYFNADWCGICKRMEREVFSEAVVVQALEAFVAVKVDLAHQPWLAQKYHVDTVPAYLKLDPSGTVKGHALGYKSPEEMEQLLHDWSKEKQSE